MKRIVSHSSNLEDKIIVQKQKKKTCFVALMVLKYCCDSRHRCKLEKTGFIRTDKEQSRSSKNAIYFKFLTAEAEVPSSIGNASEEDQPLEQVNL